MVVSNYANKMKLSYDDVCDMILTKEVHKKDFGKFFGTSLALSVDDWSWGPNKSSLSSWNWNHK